jgi:hypothetical protein
VRRRADDRAQHERGSSGETNRYHKRVAQIVTPLPKPGLHDRVPLLFVDSTMGRTFAKEKRR